MHFSRKQVDCLRGFYRATEQMQAMVLALLWRYGLNIAGKLMVCFDIHRPVPCCGRCRVLSKKIIVFQIMLRSVRPGTKAATTIGAHVQQHFVHALFAKQYIHSCRSWPRWNPVAAPCYSVRRWDVIPASSRTMIIYIGVVHPAYH